jgi:hypothetical protein
MKNTFLSKIVVPAVFVGSLAGMVCVPFAGVAQAQVVEVEPPAPRVEVVPPLPYPGAVWTPGYWGWRDGRHAWIGGTYVHGRPGYTWRRHEWVHEGRGWRMHEGGWERHR